MKNQKVAAAVVLRHAPKDPPRGLQLQGIAEMLTDQKDIDKAISAYRDRIFPMKTIKRLMLDEENQHKFYRIKPTQFVLFDAVNFGDNWRQAYSL